MGDVSDKVAYFQAITGLDDADLCTEILQAHNWDLELAVSTFTSNSASPEFHSSAAAAESSVVAAASSDPTSSTVATATAPARPPQLSLTWKLITLPFSIVSGSLGLISGAIGLGLWAAGGVLSYSLSLISNRGGVGPSASSLSSERLIRSSGSLATSEAAQFVEAFLREYSRVSRPNFVGEGFMDALARSRREFKLLFIYIHSPDHPDTPAFCEGTICNEAVSTFINENLVAWGGSIRGSEGFKMSNSLKASRFPFCAVVMAATNQRIALLQQVEGPKPPAEMMMMLQGVLEESAPVLVAARLEAEERRNNMRLREEQDAAYRAALEADQARERQRKEEQERLEREASEAERKRKEEEEARERAEREAAERAAVLARLQEEKAISLGPEPEKGPNVTQVLVRFPSGERKERRFHSDASIQMVYDYVDSLGCLEMGNYTLVSNFPRVSYGPDKLLLSLRETGLHPQASLFVEMNS